MRLVVMHLLVSRPLLKLRHVVSENYKNIFGICAMNGSYQLSLKYLIVNIHYWDKISLIC